MSSLKGERLIMSLFLFIAPMSQILGCCAPLEVFVAPHKGLSRQFSPELIGLCGYLPLWHDPVGQSLTVIPGQGQCNWDPPLQPLHGYGGVRLSLTWGLFGHSSPWEFKKQFPCLSTLYHVLGSAHS